jgi:nucleoside recognition membrane protein YjiH
MGDAILIFFSINYIFCFMIFIQINILKESPISISHLSKGIITVIIANRRTN